MAGGKKKSATQKAKGKYTKYASNGVREKNKASRIVKNILKAGPGYKEIGVTAGKVIARYQEVCNHQNAGSVISKVTTALNKMNVEIVTPKKKEG